MISTGASGKKGKRGARVRDPRLPHHLNESLLEGCKIQYCVSPSLQTPWTACDGALEVLAAAHRVTRHRSTGDGAAVVNGQVISWSCFHLPAIYLCLPVLATWPCLHLPTLYLLVSTCPLYLCDARPISRRVYILLHRPTEGNGVEKPDCLMEVGGCCV
ncbi:hypothetical protein O3P69_017418 [Scylla paramamosain]|uniref:Uncharacterized protein n=1 Tax=Scylla paramamosain TaxID=85552 RepID=A0AAW0TYQ6_SCYPA